MNIDKYIEKIDPQLWQAVCVLTKSMSERRETPQPQFMHTKKVRQFFICCCIMYCINEDYTIPLHTLITDIIEGQGGSELLIKILNRLGVCSSVDTLDRYIQRKNTDITASMNRCLNEDGFIVLSLDNIDFIASYARVCKSKNTRNTFNATSLQAVQPIPSLSELNDLSPTRAANKRLREPSVPSNTYPPPKKTRIEIVDPNASKRPREDTESQSSLPATKRQKRMPQTGTELARTTLELTPNNLTGTATPKRLQASICSAPPSKKSRTSSIKFWHLVN